MRKSSLLKNIALQVVRCIFTLYDINLFLHLSILVCVYLALQKLGDVDHDSEHQDGDDVYRQHCGVTPVECRNVDIYTRLRTVRWLYAHSHCVVKLARAMREIAFYCQKCLCLCISLSIIV